MFAELNGKKLAFNDPSQGRKTEYKAESLMSYSDLFANKTEDITFWLIEYASSIFQERDELNKESRKIKKDIISMREIKKKYRFFGPLTEKEIKQRWIKSYDRKGNLTELRWEEAGKLKRECVIEYDLNSNLKRLSLYNKKNELIRKITYSYRDSEKLAEELCYEGREDKLVKRSVYSYNQNHIKVKIFKGEDQLKAILKYELNENNNLVKALGFDQKDCLIVGFKYDYDLDLKKQELVCRDKQARKARITYSYDDSGNKVAEVKYDGENKLNSRIDYKYDDQGEIIGETYTPETEDADPQTGETTIYELNQDKMVFDYQYDKQGNWRKKTYLFWDDYSNQLSLKPAKVLEREIKYY